MIANLALYFALHTLFGTTTVRSWGPVRLEVPDLRKIRPVSLAITLIAAWLVFRLRWSVLRTLVRVRRSG